MRAINRILPFGVLICIYLTIVLAINNNYSVSALLPFSPMLYLCGLYLVNNIRSQAFKSITVDIIFAIWFLRMVLIPVIYVLSGYSSVIENSTATDNLNFAVLLVSFEYMCVILLILSSKKISRILDYESVPIDESVDTKKSISVIAFIMVIVAIICVMADSSVLSIISTIFDKLNGDQQTAILRRQEFLMSRSNAKIAFQVFFNVVYYIQILIPALLISVFVRKTKYSNNINKGCFACIVISCSAVLVTTDQNIDSVCILIASLLVVYSLYKEILENKIVIMVVGILLFCLYFLLKKNGMNTSEGSLLKELSNQLCAYFAGYPNVSAGISMQIPNKLSTLFGDIVAGTPYMMIFFKGFPKTVTIYNEHIHGYSGVTNQIVPLIVTGYQYFSIFAPVLTIIVYNLALMAELRFKNSSNVMNKIIFAVMMINLSIGPCIFGFPNTIKRLCYFIPLILLTKINSHSIKND